MRKVYVSGALTEVPNADEIKGFYEEIGKLCRRRGFEAYVPHVNGTDPVKNPNLLPQDVFETDFHHVSTSDLVIAYVGVPSLGVGIELGWAQLLDIPIILLYEENKRVSRLPRGLPIIMAEIKFRSYEDALYEINTILEERISQKTDRDTVIKNALHLEIQVPPPPSKQHVVVRNGNGLIVFEGEAPHNDKTYLNRVLKELKKERGFEPEVVYIEPFVNSNTIKSIWPEAELRLTYW